MYAAAEGSSCPSTAMVRLVVTAATTALQEEVPSIRIRVLRLLAAAVSDAGTASMMSSGSAE